MINFYEFCKLLRENDEWFRDVDAIVADPPDYKLIQKLADARGLVVSRDPKGIMWIVSKNDKAILRTPFAHELVHFLKDSEQSREFNYFPKV